MQAEATAIAAQRQAEKQAEQELADDERAGHSLRHSTGCILLPGGLTPSRAPPPQVNTLLHKSQT